MENLKIELTQHPKKKPGKGDKLGFGTVFTDHMMLMEYDRGIGWHDARIAAPTGVCCSSVRRRTSSVSTAPTSVCASPRSTSTSALRA